MELIGTNGVIIIEFSSWNEYTISTYDAAIGQWEVACRATRRDLMFEAEDKEFLEAIAHGRPILCDVHEGLKSLEVAVAANELGVMKSKKR